MDFNTSEKFIEQQQESDLLSSILSQVGGDIVVQFGPENKASDYLNGIRISKIATPAGMQFRISDLDVMLRETASQYLPTIDEAMKIAINRRKYYTRETPIRKLLMVRAKDMNWYLCERPEDANRISHTNFR